MNADVRSYQRSSANVSGLLSNLISRDLLVTQGVLKEFAGRSAAESSGGQISRLRFLQVGGHLIDMRSLARVLSGSALTVRRLRLGCRNTNLRLFLGVGVDLPRPI